MDQNQEYHQYGTTVQSLQNYITELTHYINQNNAKYTKNLETLKKFYEQQIYALEITKEENQSQILFSRNQIVTLKDCLIDKQSHIKDLLERQTRFKEQNQELRDKLNRQRKKIDQIYVQMGNIKKQFRNDLDLQQSKLKQSENQKNDLILKLKEKESQINSLKKDVAKLEDQVSERYSLPQKLKDFEIERAKDRTNIQNLSKKNKEIQKKHDFQNAQLERLQKQNQRLRINNQKLSSNLKHQVQSAVMIQKQKGDQKNKRLSSTNQKQLFQINQLQNTLKKLRQEANQLQKQLKQERQLSNDRQKKINNHDLQKQEYITEFRKLKHQYEEVIQRLQNSIPNYQKKNWALQQENKDLNVQLDGLRDLLNQMKAMNSLQPLKQEYRKWAELELIASKSYQNEKNNERLNTKSPTKQVKFQQNSNDTSVNWDKLLLQIDSIQV